MQSTYSSEVLARTKKYREQSYINTPSKLGEDATRPVTTNATLMITSPSVPPSSTVMEDERSEDANTTDDEKDKYQTLVRELNRLDKKSKDVITGHAVSHQQATRAQEKLDSNLQGEIGSEISTIEHVIDKSTMGAPPMDIDELEQSRRWRLAEESVEERSRSRHSEKSKNLLL